MVVSLSSFCNTPVKIRVLPSLTLINPVSNLLIDNKSISPHPIIVLLSEGAETAGDKAKVIKPLSSTLTTLAPKVNPDIP